MFNIKSFDNFLNESAIKLQGMKFVITCFYDNQGLAIQFIPDSKTSKDVSKNEQVNIALESLKKALPGFGDMLWFESGAGAAGLIFRLDTTELTNYITKKIK